MCGIYGQFRFRDTPDPQTCLRRLALLAHRGPDHRGHFSHGGIFLGHARLSILDPEPDAHQPFGADAQRLIYNGEIYNFRDLRSQIPDASWSTQSDTEVLYRLLQRQGESCLPQLNGMFAFAYWNKGEGGETPSLLLARDRTGIKPLYYRIDQDGLEFASEIKAFEITPPPEKLCTLKEVLARGHIGLGELPFPEVRELEPGHCMRMDLVSGKWELRAFAVLPSRVNPDRLQALRNSRSLASELEKRLENSVDLHLQSDAPLASLCSGGVDSTLLSALALKRRKDLPLYHCGVEGPGGEEDFARRAARHLSTDLIVERMGPVDFLELLPQATWHLDLPVYHPNDMSLYLIAKRAHRDGIKVLLCGEGADELFGGYSWHRDFARLLRGRARLARFGNTAERTWKRIRALSDFWLGKPHYTVEETTRFAAAGLCYPPPGIDGIFKGYALFSEDFRAWKRWDDSLRAYAGRVPAEEASVQALMLDNLQGHLRSILHRTDRILMANSIEGRVPFLENSLLDFGLNLPLSAKLRGNKGKFLLKEVARKYLPAFIINRPKMGFPVPWERSLPQKPEILENGFVAHWTGLNTEQLQTFHLGDPLLRFRLIALEVWGRIFVFDETPDSIRVI